MEIETLEKDKLETLAQMVHDHLMSWEDYWLKFKILNDRWIVTAYRPGGEEYKIDICDTKKLKKEMEETELDWDVDFENELEEKREKLSNAYYESLVGHDPRKRGVVEL